MKTSNFYKIILVLFAIIFFGSINSFATTEQENSMPINDEVDNIAPVFSPNTKKRYILKRADDGSQFIPEEIITDINATDDIDGKNVKIAMIENNVNLQQDGIYQVLYTATDKSGNISALCIEVIVDGVAPTFKESVENLYFINHSGVIFDSNHNLIEKLPEMITATDALGAYAGIGIYLTDVDNEVVFIQKVENSPADKALEINDVLVSVDGENISGKTAAYAASKIKGEEGTVVTLEVLRNGELETVTIEREIIKLYGEEDCIAEPDVDITNIDIQKNGIIEITYTATDQAGNVATVVVKIVVGEIEEDKITTDIKQEVENSEKLDNITTGDNPPKSIENLEKNDIKNEIEVKEDNSGIETMNDNEEE